MCSAVSSAPPSDGAGLGDRVVLTSLCSTALPATDEDLVVTVPGTVILRNLTDLGNAIGSAQLSQPSGGGSATGGYFCAVTAPGDGDAAPTLHGLEAWGCAFAGQASELGDLLNPVRHFPGRFPPF